MEGSPQERFVAAWALAAEQFASGEQPALEPTIQLGLQVAELRLRVRDGRFYAAGAVVAESGLLPLLCEEDGIDTVKLSDLGRDSVAGLVEAFAVRIVLGLHAEDDLVSLLRGLPGVDLGLVPRMPPERPRMDVEKTRLPDVTGLVPIRPEPLSRAEAEELVKDSREAPAALAGRMVDWALQGGRVETAHAEQAERIAVGAAAAAASGGDWRSMVRIYRALHRAQQGARPLSFLGPGRLLRLMERVGQDNIEVPRDFLEVLRVLPGDPLARLVEVLSRSESAPTARRPILFLLEAIATDRLTDLLDALDAASGRTAVDLAALVTRQPLADAVSVAVRVARHPERDVVLAGLALLVTAPIEARGCGLLFSLLNHERQEVREQAMELLGRRKEQVAWVPIAGRLDADAGTMSSREQARAGATLAALDPDRALGLVREWMKPEGLGWIWGGQPRRIELVAAAIGALVGIPSPEADKWLGRLATRLPEGELRDAVLAAQRTRGTG